MAYNVDFLLSALIFLLIILNHFMEQRALNTKSTKAFLTFLLLGIANIVFDLLRVRPELAPLETRLLCHSPTSDEPVYPA